jgi:Transmembrane secretion effector
LPVSRRTGASSWRLCRDSAEEDRIMEQFVVASWEEHLRQHERVTKHDQERYTAIQALTDPARPGYRDALADPAVPPRQALPSGKSALTERWESQAPRRTAPKSTRRARGRQTGQGLGGMWVNHLNRVTVAYQPGHENVKR